VGTRLEHDASPNDRAPSGLPLRHLVSGAIGAGLYVGEQRMPPEGVVPRHTHPVEEVLIFLAGEGIAAYGDESTTVGPGITLYIPAGEPHGFRNTGAGELRVLLIFPTPEFAETVQTS